VIYIDSTENVDAMQCLLTVVLSATKAGAVPLCVLIHQRQSKAGYEIAFGVLKSHYPKYFGGKTGKKSVKGRCMSLSNQVLTLHLI